MLPSSSWIGIYMLPPDEGPTGSGIVMSLLAVGLAVDCWWLVSWAKAKLDKDPNAFQDE